MVFQHFMLADNLTVLENVVLGAEKLHGIGDAARAEIRKISEKYGFGLDPDELVETLGVGERQRVEILKVLYRGAKILILDEPTAVLVPQEVDELFDNLRELKSEGLTVIFISHKLDEVLSVADDITVIRRGTTVATVDPKSVTARQLAELMVGSELPSPSTEESTVTDRVLLSVRDIERAGRARPPRADRHQLRDPRRRDPRHRRGRGQRPGRAGRGRHGHAAPGLGQRPAGWRRTSPAGRRGSAARPASATSPRTGTGTGLLLDSPLWENRILGHQTRPPSVKGGWLDVKGAREDTERIIAEYDVRTPGIDTTARALSGGNQQKFIVGREMSGDPILLIASHPTRGVDVGAQAAIWDHIKKARREGLAVLLISADLDELIGLSDTIRVILRGRLVGRVRPPDRHAGGARLGDDRGG